MSAWNERGKLEKQETAGEETWRWRMPLSYARWSELELSEDEEDAPAPSSAIGREGARADTQERFDTVVANQQKRPVREQLCPGPRSEEDLLKEQVRSSCTPCEQVPACLHGCHSQSNRM